MALRCGPKPNLSPARKRVNARYTLSVDELDEVKAQYLSPRVAKESVAAAVRTADQLIVGRLHVRPQKRLKDELNVINERYIAVTDARVYDAAGARLLYTTSFLLVANAEIVTVAPLDALQGPPELLWLGARPSDADTGS